MIYDPLNSLIFFSLIQVVVFLVLHFHSPVLTRDRQDNRNYREIKFSTTSFPVGPRQPVPGLKATGGVKLHMRHGRTPLNADACSRLVSGLYSVWLAYFVFHSDLVWQLTEGWEQRSCRPWSARRNSWDAPRQGESYLVTPTLPSAVTAGLLYRLLPFFIVSCQPAAPALAAIHTKCCSQFVFHIFSQKFRSCAWEATVLGLYCFYWIVKHCLVTVQLLTFYGVLYIQKLLQPWHE